MEAVGGVTGGTLRALRFARASSTPQKGNNFVKGRAALRAWEKSMKKVIPGGKYDKSLRGTRKRSDAQFF